MNEAILGALIVAQLAEMRLALRALGRRVDSLEQRPHSPGVIIRAGLAFVAGVTVYLVAR